MVRVDDSAGDPIMLIAGAAGAEQLHFQRSPDGSLRSLAAVPLGEESEVALDLTVIYADGREEIVRTSVPVTPGQYDHRRLTVAPSYVDLPPEVRKPGAAVGTSVLSLSQMEKRHIADVLEKTGGNKSQAAKLLDISRDTLYQKIKQFGLD